MNATPFVLFALTFTLLYYIVSKRKLQQQLDELVQEQTIEKTAAQTRYISLTKDFDTLRSQYSDLLAENRIQIQELKTKDVRLKEQAALWKAQTQSMIAEREQLIKDARKDSVDKSRAVLRGQATEHLAPFLIPDTNPKDYRFIGQPIDFLFCDGLSDITDGEGNEIKNVVLLDIKTGQSQLNKAQRRIRDAIKAGRIVFATYNPDTETYREW